MKDKKILYGIIITFVFLLSMGFTYAYFSVTTNVQGEARNVEASTGTISLSYVDSDSNLILNAAHPGDTATKTMVITNTGSLDTNYNIKWKTISNEITNEELVIELTCASYSTYYGEGNANNVSTGSCGYTYDIVGNSTEGSIVSMVDIRVGEIQVYNVTVTFLELNIVQNYNQGKRFAGELMVGEGVEEATVRGYLYNQSGSPIANATIETHSTLRTAVTDENGRYTLYGLEYGNHEITVKNSLNETIATDTFTIAKETGYSTVENSKDVKWNEAENRIKYMKLNLSSTNTLNNIEIITKQTTSENCFAFDSETGTITQYYYYENNNNTEPACPMDVIIPSTIGGVNVTSIGYEAFMYGCGDSVIVPTSSHTLKYNIIKLTAACNDSPIGITSVTIPSSVTIIGMYAFEDNFLANVTIPSSVTSIDVGAFANNQLTNITIPSSVTSIDAGAFANNQLTNITIPSSVTYIGEGAFSNNQLTNITIPSSVTYIGEGAFANNLLTSVTINGTPTIGCYAFFGENHSASVNALNVPCYVK